MKQKQLNLLIEFEGILVMLRFLLSRGINLIHALVEKSGYTKALKLVKCYFAFLLR
jgi:hypothetical protein